MLADTGEKCYNAIRWWRLDACRYADMAELADALDLGSSVNRRAGSSPVIRNVKPLVL